MAISNLTPSRHNTSEQKTNTTKDAEAQKSPKPRLLPYWKNFFILCVSFCLIFIAQCGSRNIQSSINTTAGLGVLTLAVMNCASGLSNLYTPIFISKMGAKWSLVLGFSGQVLYIACNFVPEFYSLIPGALLNGIVNGAMWTGQGVFMANLAREYAQVTFQQASNVISQFNGIFYLFYHLAQILGSLISSIVLSNDSLQEASFDLNVTEEYDSKVCGAYFCNLETTDEGVTKSEASFPYLLFAIYGICALLATCLFAFIADNRKQKDQTSPGVCSLISTTIKAHKNIELLLILPTFLWGGIQQSILFGEFSQAFVSCSQGVHIVGYVMMGFGTADAIACLLFGILQKYIGRFPIFLLGFLLNICLLFCMLIWDPVTGNSVLLFVIPALWGVADAIWTSRLAALVGTLFTKDQNAAFASMNLGLALGICLPLMISSYMCMAAKIYFSLACCIFAFVLYLILEAMLKYGHKSKVEPLKEGNTDVIVTDIKTEKVAIKY